MAETRNITDSESGALLGTFERTCAKLYQKLTSLAVSQAAIASNTPLSKVSFAIHNTLPKVFELSEDDDEPAHITGRRLTIAPRTKFDIGSDRAFDTLRGKELAEHYEKLSKLASTMDVVPIGAKERIARIPEEAYVGRFTLKADSDASQPRYESVSTLQAPNNTRLLRVATSLATTTLTADIAKERVVFSKEDRQARVGSFLLIAVTTPPSGDVRFTAKTPVAQINAYRQWAEHRFRTCLTNIERLEQQNAPGWVLDAEEAKLIKARSTFHHANDAYRLALGRTR